MSPCEVSSHERVPLATVVDRRPDEVEEQHCIALGVDRHESVVILHYPRREHILAGTRRERDSPSLVHNIQMRANSLGLCSLSSSPGLDEVK